jgi:hypothetical protein
MIKFLYTFIARTTVLSVDLNESRAHSAKKLRVLFLLEILTFSFESSLVCDDWVDRINDLNLKCQYGNGNT